MHIRDGISLSLRKCAFPRASSLLSRNSRNSRAGVVHRSENAEFHAWERSITRKMQKLTRWRDPPLGKCGIPRAGEVHRSGIAKTHALERSIAQKMQNLTRRRGPSLGKCRNSRAGEFHRSGIEKSRALECSLAQESQNPTRGNDPAPKNRIFSRASSAFLL